MTIKKVEDLDQATIEFLIKKGLLDEQEVKKLYNETSENNGVLIGELLEEFKTSNENISISEKTYKMYIMCIENFLRFYYQSEKMDEISQEKLGLITIGMVENWIEYLVSTGETKQRLMIYKSAIAKFFYFLSTKGHKLPNVKKVNVNYDEDVEVFDAIRDEEIREIANYSPTGRGKAIILFMYETGIKRHELTQCKRSHVDFEKRTVNIYKKDKIVRVGYLSKEVSILIQRYLEEWELEVKDINEKRLIRAAKTNQPYNPVEISEYLFQTYLSGMISYATIQRAINDAVEQYCTLKKIEASRTKVLKETVTSETLRHSRRVYYLSEGKSIEQVKALMGDEYIYKTSRFLPIAHRLYPEKFRD